jgi:hypothetical protein
MANAKNGKQTVSASEVINSAFKGAKSANEIKNIEAKLKEFIEKTAKQNAAALKPEKKAKAAKEKKSVKVSKEEYISRKREEAAAKVLKVRGVEVPQLDAKDAKKVAKLGIRFVDYSEKAFLVFSDTTVGIGKNEAGETVEVGATMLLHKELAQLGGGYKNWAKAWLFSKANAEKQVKELFGKGITPMTKAEYEKAKTA